MRSESFGISSVIKKRQEQAAAVEACAGDFENLDESLNEEPVIVHNDADVVDVDISDLEVDAIELPVINDEHGRLSDMLESLERETGLSVIPLEMGHVAPEVRSFSKHKIFENGGKRYAMSHHIRYEVINKLQNEIVRTLQSGLPYEKCLNIKVTYRGVEYDTLSLSEDEWTFIIAKFRKYKTFLTKSGDRYTLRILAERV